MVVAVFEAMASEPQLFLPLSERAKYNEAKEATLKKRVICDYIAGMTDSFLLKSYERMFSPRLGSVFDKL
jgi:dGTPase